MACVFYNVPYVFSYKVNLFLQVHIYADKDTFYTKNQMVYLFSFRRVSKLPALKRKKINQLHQRKNKIS